MNASQPPALLARPRLLRRSSSSLAAVVGVALNLWLHVVVSQPASALDWLAVAPDGSGFIREPSGEKFLPWGFNYDHDDGGRLLEDYWEKEWPTVEEDFAEMRRLGANLVRIHLQFGRFMNQLSEPNPAALRQLERLLALAEKEGLYLDLTGLGCYHKADVPAWYDALSETNRWEAQANFWKAIAQRCRNSPAVFCYDLMNEPVVAGGDTPHPEWLGPAFAGKHFVQFVTRDRAGRPAPDVAVAWTRTLVQAIRAHDSRHLTTVGLVDWSLNRPGLRSGFEPARVAPHLDFLCVHLYPKTGEVKEALTTLEGFRVGKPVLIEETFPLWCSIDDFKDFVQRSRPLAAGHCGFYWGKTLEQCRASKELRDALMAAWLEFFQGHRPAPPAASGNAGAVRK